MTGQIVTWRLSTQDDADNYAYHQTHIYHWTLPNIWFIPSLNLEIFVSLDPQTGGLQMFFEHKK
jgi:hypothetical protein